MRRGSAFFIWLQVYEKIQVAGYGPFLGHEYLP